MMNLAQQVYWLRHRINAHTSMSQEVVINGFRVLG